MKFLNHKGQALIEAAISFPMVLAAIGGISVTLYHGLIFYVADYNLHESLVCLDFASASACQAEAEKKIQSILPKYSSVKIQITKGRTSHSGKLSVQGLTRIQISKKITW